MSAVSLAGFLVLVGVAAYLQTLTGFAFGLITMGGIALTGLIPLTDAAVTVSVLTIINASLMILKGWRKVALCELILVLCASTPMIAAGYLLLEWLAQTRIDILRIIIGLVIVFSSLQLARRPEPLPRKSSTFSFLVFGAVSGLMGGLFSTSGPPLVYHFYRQPMSLRIVRETLVAVFALNALVRIGIVVGSGNLSPISAWLGLFAAPVVMAATYAARQWAPPFPERSVRYLVLILLFLSGISLAAPVVASTFG